MDHTPLMTERLHIRPATLDDAAFIYELLNAPKFKQHIGDKNIRSLDDARNYIQSRLLDSYQNLGFGMFIVTLNNNHTPIGMCGFLKRPELEYEDIGYAFLPQYEGKGFALEAAKTCLDNTHTYGIEKVGAIVSPENKGSIRLLEKMGMKFQKQLMYEGKETLLYA